MEYFSQTLDIVLLNSNFGLPSKKLVIYYSRLSVGFNHEDIYYQKRIV